MSFTEKIEQVFRARTKLHRIVNAVTTEDVVKPEEHHLDYLVEYAHKSGASYHRVVEMLLDKLQHAGWPGDIKALGTLHHLMRKGMWEWKGMWRMKQKFTNYFSPLEVFLVSTSALSVDTGTFARTYAKYLKDKIDAHLSLGFDLCKCEKRSDGRRFSNFFIDTLLVLLPPLQQQMDSLLQFDCCRNELSNAVTSFCFELLYTDLILLYACYDDIILDLLSRYPEVELRQARRTLNYYKGFVARTDRAIDFFTMAEEVTGAINPHLNKAPCSILEDLELQLAAREAGVSVGASSGNLTDWGSHNISEVSPTAPEYDDVEEAHSTCPITPNAPEYQPSQEESKEKVDLLCKICMDEAVAILFLECGHIACCVECSEQVSLCPVCRQRITRKVKAYLS